MTVEEWLGTDNNLGCQIWHKKYQYNKETLDEWFDRVSGGDQDVRRLIEEKKLLFGGRTLANRGTGKKGSLSNCYSSGYCGDSLDEIFELNTEIAKTFKSQGGQGLSLSQLRPKGAPINGGQFESDGIIPFMEIFNRTTESISQGGSRKGALIMTIDIWHKEASEFITIKSQDGKIQKANLSLEIDDKFMKDVKRYYDTGEVVTETITKTYDSGSITYEVVPIKLYKLMMESAYDWAEPGCIFTERFRNYNLMQYDDEYNIITCNPCGEQPLPKYGACNLASINLSEFVINSFTDHAYFDASDFANAVKIAIKGLDQVLDENIDNHALPQQKEMARNYRNVGLGVMGLGSALIKLGYKYGSPESIEWVDSMMDLMFRSAVIESGELAKLYGAFPKYKDVVLTSDIMRSHFTRSELDALHITEYGLRNCSLLSVAPSGSIGTMLNVSTGCEPLFALSYRRKTESLNGGQEKYYDVYCDVAADYHDMYGNDEFPEYFVTAGQISWKDRVDMQAVMQKHVDTGISSTINLPNSISLEEVEQLYLYAWEQGLKGVTIFRNGCMRTGILTTNKEPEQPQQLERGMIIQTNDSGLIGKKRTLNTGCGRLYVTAFFDDNNGDLLETFFSKGSSGGCERGYDGLSRMISLSARGGIDINSIVDQMQSVSPCPAYARRQATKHDCSRGACCPNAIGYALLDMYHEVLDELDEGEPAKTTTAVEIDKEQSFYDTCPECGAKLRHEGGCVTCPECSWSRCS